MDVITLLGQLLNSTLVFSTALIFTALGGIFSERSGVVNIGLEGLMIFGAFAAGVGTYYAQEAGMGSFSPWVGVIAAMVAGALGALIHAVATITFKADQTISGIVINFLAAGLTVYIVKLIFDGAAETPLVTVFHKFPIPVLRDIPIIGEGFFNSYPTTYLALILVAVIYFVLFKTPFGLRLRSVGEHPSAADTLGVNVTKMRYIGVLLSGVLGGIGGATITLTTTSTFAHNTISGQGFIAIAAMIFGKWNPLGAFGAAMFFGFSQAIRNYVQLFDWSRNIPQEFIFMIPYVLTIIVLVGAVGRSSAPAALGTPYDPSKR
ncbi:MULTISPECIES: ABC transporter permease [Paenibacillus]|jgi:simple sugar transport system permease protein|uniref:Simple sugar transport system permease n=2 Tax=Paenibacillus barengoltzii TaxID=343517 RepID=R9L9E3_9BACL|nr:MULTISPECIES: ABC transporter permease [Paenibacillus]EOS55404.1 simple sugar transport system permease [Paenibacillus barengoltzii G22]MDU0331509.1 ABC transporter permease [Paenibacillus sp. 3LSP]MEC2345567.1 ABC transporter permease [Paenibacillus barengoltzii]SMF38812.1 simple sugar transport system permease protein [Paenibacillus barengoltzii J12]SMF64366.1 simple sugar transport system permease protein [Paenibacillus barengoltzii]